MLPFSRSPKWILPVPVLYVPVFPVLVVYFAILLATIFVPGLPFASAQQSTISVSAVGEARIKPDRIQVQVTISNTEDGIIEARKVSDDDAKTVLSAAQKHGVAETDFKVNDLSIAIGYSNELRRNLYTITRDVSIDFNEMDKLNGLLADLLEIKNTKVRSINFRASDEKKAEFKARQIAMKLAKEKAQQLAELADLKLGRAVSIEVLSEQNTPFVTSVEPFVGSNGGGLFLRAKTTRPKSGSTFATAEPLSNRSTFTKLPPTTLIAKSVSAKSINAKSVNVAARNKVESRTEPNQPASRQAFGLGEIQISIRLNVTFQMVE